MKKRILLFGANGQLGRSIFTELYPYFSVVPCININNNNIELFNNLEYYLDITNFNLVKNYIEIIQPDVIINSCAMTNVDKCEVDRHIAYRVNVEGLKNITKSVSRSCQIIHISSDYVFDGKTGNYSEVDPTYPICYYGKTKLEAENYLRGTNLNWLILRTNVLFGNNLNAKSSFVSWVYNNLKNNNTIDVVSDQVSNPTWTTALGQVIRQCIIMNSNGLFHYGGDDVLSRYQFAKIVANAFDFDNELIKQIKTKDLSQIAKRPLISNLNTRKIVDELEAPIYTLKYSLEQIKRINSIN